MMRLAIFSTCVVLSLALSGAAPVPKDHQSPFFPTKIGTRWVYVSSQWTIEAEIRDTKKKDGVTTLTIVDNTEEDDSDPWRILTVSKKGISLVSRGPFRYERPIDLLRLPAKIGDQWKFDTHYRTVGGLTVCPKDGRMKVGAIETVKTTAGEFEAARVEGYGGGTGLWTETYWFARGVGLVKWVNNAGDEFVLKSFKLPR
jgi:hypothetical protein